MHAQEVSKDYQRYASASTTAVLNEFSTSAKGLQHAEAQRRLQHDGPNEPARKRRLSWLMVLMQKFSNPLVLVLGVIGTVSYFLNERLSVFFIAAMILISVLIDFVQEYRSTSAAEKLIDLVRSKAVVMRAGKEQNVAMKDIVVGDIVMLRAGCMIPADVRILTAKDLFVNQSSLTGESLPVHKSETLEKTGSTLQEFTSLAFMGSSVVSGEGNAIVIRTGEHTAFGAIARRVADVSGQTSFEKGVRDYTLLMVKLILILVGVLFVILAVFKGNPVEAILFSLAVAVGLTPEMLPMLMAVNLSKGAIAMSKKKVIVKRLDAIQNFGAMDVLCMDKTGTLTEDRIVLVKHCDIEGKDSMPVLESAVINSTAHGGVKNVLDRALLAKGILHGTRNYTKVDELPFDFTRKMLSVVIQRQKRCVLISKGAPEQILERCTSYELHGKRHALTQRKRQELTREYALLASDGFIVLAVAHKNVPLKKGYTHEDEHSLTLQGYVAFLDPPKTSVKKTIQELHAQGIAIKILTGDNEYVTRKICGDVELQVQHLLVGAEVDAMSDDQLANAVDSTTIFARLTPLQKERIIKALQRKHVVGFMGDGINDAPSLRAADVSISVNNAVDIAKETADIILLEKDLMVLTEGVREGRKTFGNTIKYIKMGASSNFGNMFSITGGAIFLPFLPLLPVQILLNNFLYDISQLTIPMDNVDESYLKKPRPWNVGNIKKFMLVMGPISSLFDFLTFGLLLLAGATQKFFNTGWFLECLLTQTLVIFVIRTEGNPFKSRPSMWLILSTVLVLAVGIIIPLTALGRSLGFISMPLWYYGALAVIVFAYLTMVHVLKQWLAKKYGLE